VGDMILSVLQEKQSNFTCWFEFICDYEWFICDFLDLSAIMGGLSAIMGGLSAIFTVYPRFHKIRQTPSHFYKSPPILELPLRFCIILLY
jgi:hypothetical protein